MLGGYDLAAFARKGATENDITWAKVTGETWSAEFSGVKFAQGASVGTIKSEKIMLDTGLTYALVPKDDVATVAKSLMGYNIKCEAPFNNGHLGLYQCECS